MIIVLDQTDAYQPQIPVKDPFPNTTSILSPTLPDLPIERKHLFLILQL